MKNIKWKSRGLSDGLDISGFIQTKSDGEIILSWVRKIFDGDVRSCRLDYREYEPDWIQFKFYPEEFDLEYLDKASVDNNHYLTELIVQASFERKQEEKGCLIKDFLLFFR